MGFALHFAGADAFLSSSPERLHPSRKPRMIHRGNGQSQIVSD